MRLAKMFRRAAFFFVPLFLACAADVFGAVTVDDYTPEVTARVVRVSFLRGDVQIRRAASEDPSEKQEWERAALNLPIVEGDEISTGKDTVVEIQLDNSKHIRLWENAYLKITTLRDEGVAVSLPQGTMSFRALAFDKTKSYFEIDAPATTLSVERAGLYRIDAGDTKNSEIRVSASENGEAKVYTQTSGFTLRSGRTARIFIEGNYAGDYETTEVERVPDVFDEWVLQRDAVAVKRFNEAFYDKYYDQDQFGAEDLNEYGEWIYTKKYGYVWKPYANTLGAYADWTPYRYGHWRWVPFYGWTWVNDEPWGWATYHHGRWIWDGSYWVWAPYASARWRRSWWQPAVVSIVTWNGRVIWFPLGYEDPYCDFNRGYGGYRRSRRRSVTIINNNTTVIVNPTPNPSNPSPSPSPNQPVLTPAQIRELRRTNAKTPTLQRIPFEAVVGVSAEEFGKQTRGIRTAPVRDAREILIQPIDQNQPPPALPDYKEAKGKMSTEILIQNPRIDDQEPVRVKPTGAGKREDGKAMNQKLENERIFGNRTPRILQNTPNQPDQKVDSNEPVRRTGAVNRRLPQQQTDTNQSPDFNPQTNEPVRVRRNKSDADERQQKEEQQQQQEPVRTRRQDDPVRTRKQDDENQTPPIIVQPQQQKEERRPQFPQQRREERREEPQQQRPQPRPDPKPEPKPQPRQEEQQQKPSKPNVVDRKADRDSR